MVGLTPVKPMRDTRTRPGAGESLAPDGVAGGGVTGSGVWARPDVTERKTAAPASATRTKRGSGMGTRRARTRRPAIIAIASESCRVAAADALGGRRIRLAIALADEAPA